MYLAVSSIIWSPYKFKMLLIKFSSKFLERNMVTLNIWNALIIVNLGFIDEPLLMRLYLKHMVALNI